jgi:hypothetical protein
LLGCISMWLCWRAGKQTRSKKLVLCYAVLLAPFAFSYPAWIVFIWASYVFGYRGPMP